MDKWAWIRVDTAEQKKIELDESYQHQHDIKHASCGQLDK